MMNKTVGMLLGLGLACGANAAIIAGYDFSSDKSAAVVASGASAGVVTAAGGAVNNYGLVATIGDNTGVAASGTAFGSTDGGCISSTSEGCTGTDLADAIADGDYYSITIAADVAGTLDLTGFSIDKAINSTYPERVANEWNVCAKVNGDTSAWSTADALLATSLTTTTAQGLSEWESTFIDLSGISLLQGIDSVEFRIYVWGANGTSYSNAQRIDQLVIEGSVPEAPEPEVIYNLAKFQSSSVDSANSTTPKAYGNDGFVTQENRWVSNSSSPHRYEVSLAVPMAIGSAHLYSGATGTDAISDFSLQYYNGSAWVDIAGTSTTGNTLPVLNLEFTAPVTAQRFRLYTTDATARMKELALYPPTSDGSAVPFGTDLDLNVAKLRQFNYSSVDGANYPALAIDGYVDDSSAWASTDAAGPHSFEVHFPQNEQVRGIHLYSGFEGLSGTQMEDFTVDYWSGSAWVTCSGGSVSGNTEQNLSLWFGAAVTTSKIRVYTTDSKQAVIRELVVFAENGADAYPLWTDALHEAPPSQSFLDYEDSYYTIENRETGLNLATSTNGSSITSDEPWFQVLLNIGTDTYRLRSKDSEACFEVSLASTNEGAAIVEGNYTAMPHQRWRLEDTGDGTHFQIVNVWSGLVLGLDGTNVVQRQAADADFAQQWAINYETHYPKKGQASHFHFNFMYKPGWAYNWKKADEDLVEYGQYYPMQWGGIADSTAEILRYQPGWYGRANSTTVLGFNEPNLEDQANMEEATAAYQWPRLQRMRLPLAGPCDSNYKGSWRENFNAEADERGLRTEYEAVHWYSPNGASTGSPSMLISNLEYVYNLYGRKIMLTEFSTRDFAGDKVTWSRNHNYNFLAEFMWRAESLDWLKSWSLFEWGYGGNVDTTDANGADITAMNSPKLALHYNNDSTDPGYEDLMECGLLLAGWDGDATVRDDKPYIIHNKGRFLRLIDDPSSDTIGYADVTNTEQTEQFELVAASSGNKYIVGMSSGRRLSFDGSTVGLADAGTTGSSVEWELNEYQYGWFYLDHPSTGKRLRITDANVIDATSDSTTGDNLRFRFIVPAVEFEYPADAVGSVLVGYDFDASSSYPTAPTMLSSSVIASSLTSPMDIGASASFGDTSGLDGTGVAFGSTDQLGAIAISVEDAITSSFADAVAGDDYLSFTVIPGDDRTLTLSSISFKAMKRASTSVDEYAVADSSGTMIGSAVMVTSEGSGAGIYESFVVDLGGTAFETVTAATEFRIYAWGRGTTSPWGTAAGVDKIVLRGIAGPILVGYDFAEGASEATEVVSPHVSATTLTSPMDISFPTTIGDNSGVDAEGLAFGNTGTLGCVGIGVNDATTTSFAGAVAGDDYVTFTVTPDDEVALDLTAITFKASTSVSTSVDEYAVTDESGNLIGSTVAISTLGQTTTYQAVSVDLTGNADYQGVTEPTTFRIYAWGRGTTSTGGTLAMIDKVTLHGSIAFNTTPTALPQSVSTAKNTSVAITLTGSDYEGDSLSFSVVSGPANGTLTGTAPNLTYIPTSGYVGEDSFTFAVNDGQSTGAA
ncbi:glycosyl hydrolase, partial [Pontiella sp.]|uniref:glycosyl hydrolase n=1 Tax=Pontiella sp. TaxID=2837462 RepID=UPI0035676CC4